MSAGGVRASIVGIDPDQVYREVLRCGGFRSWADPSRTLHQLGDVKVDVYELDSGDWGLNVNGGATETEKVREALHKLHKVFESLELDPDTVEITELEPEQKAKTPMAAAPAPVVDAEQHRVEVPR